jgi:ubiquitin carboxyl-terminal hydrolase 7
VPKNGTVEDLVAGLQRKLGKGADGIPDNAVSRVRVFEEHANKVYRENIHSYPVTNYSEFVHLFAEIVPKGELAGEYDEDELCPINVFHFDKEVSKPHGIPFIFMMMKVRFCGDIASR